MRIASEALTFDDVLLKPGYSAVLPREVDLATRLTTDIRLNIPLLSAAMDTVTEVGTAIALAQEGGLGVIHKNMTVEQQAKQVAAVKVFESGVVSNPITVTPDTTIRDVVALTRRKGISGVPVVEGTQTLGIVTHRDLRFETQLDAPVASVMTPQERLVTVREGAAKEEVLALLHQHRIEKVLVVGEDFELRGMITAKDFQKAETYPLAAKDERGALRVGAAVGTGADTDERVDALVRAGVDVVVVDTSHGFSENVLARVRRVRQTYPDLQIIAGNIVTGDAALALVEAGANAVKVGIGPGSICTTRVVAGVGVPQISAVADVAAALASSGVPLIADGGIRYSGDIAKALAAGAFTAMIGGLFAGTEESPGRGRAVSGPFLQVLPRYGVARRDGRGLVGPLLPGRDGTARENSCRKGSRAAYRTRVHWWPSSISCSADCAPQWVTPVVRALPRCARSRNSCVSPRRVSVRATCTMSPLPRKHPITAANEHR